MSVTAHTRRSATKETVDEDSELLGLLALGNSAFPTRTIETHAKETIDNDQERDALVQGLVAGQDMP